MKHTNKRLLLIRHAKSSWSDAGMTDFDRPLNQRGLAAAPFMAKQWCTKVSGAALLVSSSAVRAQTTARIFSETFASHFCHSFPVQLKAELYHATPLEILHCLTSLPTEVDEVLLFGHNPGISEAVTYLTGEPCSMPTCAIADISFDCSGWQEISHKTGALVAFDYPKKYSFED